MNQVDLDRAVGYALKRTQAALRAAMDVELRSHGLSVPQYACLELLAQRPELSNAELARGAFVSRQAMHQLLRGLRSSGLIGSHGRGRGERFTLTDNGTQRLAAASRAVARIEQQMLAPLTQPERRHLHAHLAACADALAPHARS